MDNETLTNTQLLCLLLGAFWQTVTSPAAVLLITKLRCGLKTGVIALILLDGAYQVLLVHSPRLDIFFLGYAPYFGHVHRSHPLWFNQKIINRKHIFLNITIT